MTIYRVDTDRDLAEIVKKGPKRVKDPELEKALKELRYLDKWRTALEELKYFSKSNVEKARKVYTICDTRLKEKGLSKDDEGELLAIRKIAYDFTMQMKKAGFI